MKTPLLLLLGLVALWVVSCGKIGPGQPGQTVEQLQAGIEGKHPAEYYLLAKALFGSGKKDEAVFWFYAGQLRFRYHLVANPKLDPSGDPALLGSLSEVVGRPINEYAFGNVPKLAQIIDSVLAWDEATENGFTPKSAAPREYQEIRSGLDRMKGQILAKQDQIKAQRKAAGL
jgi:hypothetical protein